MKLFLVAEKLLKRSAIGDHLSPDYRMDSGLEWDNDFNKHTMDLECHGQRNALVETFLNL